jgi:hypothetical protein
MYLAAFCVFYLQRLFGTLFVSLYLIKIWIKPEILEDSDASLNLRFGKEWIWE